MWRAWIRGAIAAVALGAVALTGGAARAQTYYGGAGVSVSFGVFYDTLAPYGTWQYVQGYGQVWRPDPYVVGADFTPYGTAGRWVYTDYGWAWASDWDWGWAPFHYGRWTMDSVLGWVWIPGTVWAPAWVQWRYGGGYVGWCPLGPAGVSVGFGVGYGYGYGYYPYAYWSFVPAPYFIQPNPIHYVVPRTHYHQAYAATQPLPHQVTYHQARWYAGPPPGVIARQTGQTVAPINVRPPVPGRVQPVRPMGVPPPSYHPPLGTQAQRPPTTGWRPGYGGSGTPPPGQVGRAPTARQPGTVYPPNLPQHYSPPPTRYEPPPTRTPPPNYGGEPARPPPSYHPPPSAPPPPPPSSAGSSAGAHSPPPSPPPSGGRPAAPPNISRSPPPSHASPPPSHASPPPGKH